MARPSAAQAAGGAAGTSSPGPEQEQRQRSPAQLWKMVHSQNASPAAKQLCQDTRSLSLGELEGAQSKWGRVAITLGRLLHSPSEASHPAKQ